MIDSTVVRNWSASVAGIVMLAMAAAVQARALPDFTDLVEANKPSVVNISTTQKVKRQFSLPEGFDLPEDSPFHDFFRHFFGDGNGNGEGNGEPRGFDAKSLGSGFVISQDGYVLTNNHVVQDAEEIIVRLSDRREYKATVVGTDDRSDVALLKIEAKGLPVARLGKSSDLKVGEWVLAIGSPFGFDHSVTAGIVSAKGRSLPRENYVPFIQTDVAINPGNSGGPLYNLRGEVVGVNAQIYSRTGGFMGLSFAIPIEVAMDVAEQLKTKGRVTRGWLGVLIQDVTSDLAESFGMKKPHGALVARVLPDSPASSADLQVGDVIVEFNGQHIERSKDLPPMVGRMPIDRDVPVKVIRNGKPVAVTVKVGELPEEDELRVAGGGSGPESASDKRLGLSVVDLTREQREQRGIESKGVLVTSISDGPAYRSGIRKGDVVLMINNVEIENARHFEQVIDSLPDKRSVPVLVQRRSGPIFLALRME